MGPAGVSLSRFELQEPPGPGSGPTFRPDPASCAPATHALRRAFRRPEHPGDRRSLPGGDPSGAERPHGPDETDRGRNPGRHRPDRSRHIVARAPRLHRRRPGAKPPRPRIAERFGPFRRRLRDMAFLVELLPDSALRRRVAIPDRIGLRGSAAADKGAFSVASTLSVGDGRIVLDGRLDPRQESYDAEFRCDSFPAGRFLPSDSLGMLDLALTARGAGFNTFRSPDPGEPPGADRPCGVPRSRLRRHRAGGGFGRPPSFGRPLRPGFGPADVADALRCADRGAAGGAPRRQNRRFRPRTDGLRPGAARRFVPARRRGIGDPLRQLCRPRGLDSIVIRSGYRTDRIRATSLVRGRRGLDPRRGVVRRPVAAVLVAQSAGLADRGPDPERRHAGRAKSASRKSIWSSCNPCFRTSTCKPQPDGTIS